MTTNSAQIPANRSVPRSHVIGVRVTESERVRFAALAARHGLRPAAWLRMVALHAAADQATGGSGQ